MAFVAIAIGFTPQCAHAEEFEGELTTYTLSAPSSGNCNFMHAPEAASQNYAAINAEQWESTKACGRYAEVSCADSRCTSTSKTELVYILDQCPECKKGDLDVSPSVFKSLTGSEPSRYKTKWRFINCPVTGNIKYCLKDGSNPYYIAIQPTNIATGVKEMTINTKSTGMVTSAYYYLLEGANLGLGAVGVSVTSEDGEVVTETLELAAGSCTDGTKQFASAAAPPPAPSVDMPAPPSPAPAPPPPPAAEVTETSPPPPATEPPTNPPPLEDTPAPKVVPAPVPQPPTPAKDGSTDINLQTKKPTKVACRVRERTRRQ